MEALLRHMIEPIVDHPEDISVQVIEGDAATMIELVVHEDDRDKIEGNGGRTLRSLRNVLSAAAGRRKASLDLVEAHGEVFDEE